MNLTELANAIAQYKPETLKRTPALLHALRKQPRVIEMAETLERNGMDLGAFCFFVRQAGEVDECPALDDELWANFKPREAMVAKLKKSAVGWKDAKPATRRKMLLKATSVALQKAGNIPDFKARRREEQAALEAELKAKKLRQQRAQDHKARLKSQVLPLSLDDSINLQTVRDRLRHLDVDATLTQLFHAGLRGLRDFDVEELQDLVDETAFSRPQDEHTLHGQWHDPDDKKEKHLLADVSMRCAGVEMKVAPELLFRLGLAALLEFDDEELRLLFPNHPR